MYETSTVGIIIRPPSCGSRSTAGIEAPSPPWLGLDLLMKLFGGSSHSACEGLIYSDEKSGGGHHHADPGAPGRSESDIFY